MNGVAAKKLWWAGPAIVVLILLLLSMFAGTPPAASQGGSTYGAAPEGIRAAFLLLEGLGFDVKVSRRVAQGQARWVLFPRLERDNMSVLDAWVRDGGRLLLADEDVKAAAALGVPVDRAW